MHPVFFFNITNKTSKALSKTHKYAEHTWLVDALLHLNTSDLPLNKEVREKLFDCIAVLPSGAAVDFTALMLGRSHESVRIVIDLGTNSLRQYLEAVGYSYPMQDLIDLVDRLGVFGRLAYNLDISGTVLPKVGIECFPNKDTANSYVEQDELLNHLVSLELCSPGKRDALLSWQGQAPASLPYDLWPARLVRGINHIKVTYEPGGELEAKCYLAYKRVFVSEMLSGKKK